MLSLWFLKISIHHSKCGKKSNKSFILPLECDIIFYEVFFLRLQFFALLYLIPGLALFATSLKER